MTPSLKAVVTAAIIGCTSASEAGQKVLKGDDNPLDQSFGEFVEKELEKWHLPGLSVAVVDGDETWAEGYGYATLPSTPVEPSTLFYTGSTTKAFTAAVLALMIESEGGDNDNKKSAALSARGWQTSLASILGDDFVLQDGDGGGGGGGWATAHLTLEDALSHRTGLPRHDKALARFYGQDRHQATVRDYTRSLRHLPMVAEPRVAWRYCNYMYLVVSHAIETLTGGRWLGDTMRDWIWTPLGMHSTYFSLEEAERAPEHLASGYYWDYSYTGGGFTEVPHMPLHGGSGAGGIVSNVLDYARWVRSLLREEGPVPKAGHAAVKTPRMVMPLATRKGYDAPMAYALGWMLSTYKGRRVCTHSGSMETFGTEVYFFPDLDYGVVTMGNTQVSSNIVGQLVAWKLINDKLGVPEEERWDWAGSFNKSIEQMLSAGDTALDELYPERADPPLPRALPIDDYLGTYYHPAYQHIRLVRNQSNGTGDDAGRRELKAVRDDFVWKMTFEFEHVSGEFWLVYVIPRGSGGIGTQFAKAEFRVRATGKVEALEIEFFEEGSEGLIVFEKIA
ncbi:hypothetical protein SLS62_005753 [Diatrype stigma]|uniref:Beta-lactamase-related domain-containing protein n=1 Tax=Diatrype stigma TaxID=117547 RepID=A0AAN9UZQ6_9PEZI